MFDKIIEDVDEYGNYKLYSFDNDMNLIEVLNQLSENGYYINSVRVEEAEADVGLKSIDNTYSYEDLVKEFENISGYDTITVEISSFAMATFNYTDHILTFKTSPDVNFDFNDMLGEKKTKSM